MRAILLLVLLPLIALRLLGLLQPLEWTAYDLLFYFSPNEPRDERIMIVAWDEQDLQATKEATLSDQKLVSVLEKIKAQEPRLIGLDLYRDVPVPSFELGKQQNQEAYSKLQAIFRSTENLVGIEKVRLPIIDPPPALKEEGRVFASDLIKDADNIVRRAYIANQPREKNDPDSYRTVFYVGTKLGVEYLVKEGFSYQGAKDGSLVLSKEPNQIVINNLKTFDGGYINNLSHLDFLIDWRRGNNLFKTVSVRELIAGEVPPDLFRDKIVLIGNISSSSSDRHNITITRWAQIQSWTYGVEIVAHVTSSIISAALDGRPLIKVAPLGSSYITLAISVASIAYLIFKFSNFRSQRLYLLSALSSLGLTILVCLGSLLAFQFGWWIPVVPAILGIWLTFIILNNHLQITKEQENVEKLELICNYLDHKLGNSTNLIEIGIAGIEKYSNLIYRKLVEDYQEAQAEDYYPSDRPFLKTKNGQNLSFIKLRVDEIKNLVKSITRYRDRTTQMVGSTSLKKEAPPELVKLNDFTKQVINLVLTEKKSEYNYDILVQEIYDSNLQRHKIDPLLIEMSLENLLDNAFYAVNPKANQGDNYQPTVIVQTKKRTNRLEISVEDNGSGIPQSKQQKIFQPFVSFKMDRGQGIGLALVKRLLSLEQGTIKVESKVGKGSKFTISLPIKRK